MFPLFPLGQVVATPGALAALERAKQPARYFLTRHVTGDWEILDPEDVAENEYSMVQGFRLLSSYETDAGEKLWVNYRSGPVCNHAAVARRVLTGHGTQLARAIVLEQGWLHSLQTRASGIPLRFTLRVPTLEHSCEEKLT